jgi:alpha-galactosidase
MSLIRLHESSPRSLVHVSFLFCLKGLKFDWYKNNDGCCEAGKVGPYYTNDAMELLSYGMDGCKFDNCGPGRNMTLWAEALNATGREFLIEDCNDNDPFRPTVNPDGTLDCPYHFFRTGIDNSPHWHSMVSNLMDANEFLNISGPGCWAYPDMLEVGAPLPTTVTQCPGGGRLSYAQAQAEFAAWCVVSSPLILSFDMSNETEYAMWWPIVSNTEAIAVNQQYVSEAGHLVASSTEQWGPAPVYHGADCEVAMNRTLPVWTVWAKAQPNNTLAAVALNTLEFDPISFSITVEQLGYPSNTVLAVRDLNAHVDLPNISGAWNLALGPSGSQFVLFTPVGTLDEPAAE